MFWNWFKPEKRISFTEEEYEKLSSDLKQVSLDAIHRMSSSYKDVMIKLVEMHFEYAEEVLQHAELTGNGWLKSKTAASSSKFLNYINDLSKKYKQLNLNKE